AFIKKILTGNLRGSARVILEANILGESCGRVCPTEVLCEGACVMHEKGEQAIEIGRLQRYAVDYVLDNNIHLFHAGASNGKRVACIGSGPRSEDTRLNSSHQIISYAVFCLKKKKYNE